MKLLLNKSVILIFLTVISWSLACDGDDCPPDSSSGASSSSSSGSSSGSSSSGSSSSSSSASSSSSTSGDNGCDNTCKKCNNEPKCPCFDLNYCPLEYGSVCAYNEVCYRVFRSKCEIEDLNSYAEEGDKKWKILPMSSCAGAPVVNGCNNCQHCVAETNNEVCAYSCVRGCYRTFNSYCQLPQQNCNHPNDDYYTFRNRGRCENQNVVLCIGNVGLF